MENKRAEMNKIKKRPLGDPPRAQKVAKPKIELGAKLAIIRVFLDRNGPVVVAKAIIYQLFNSGLELLL